ncbi:unnamed protein product [Polarella glacialis]|uniref:Uncharacterized protein n=1 Tax=Polarella glacialis TaxID=89957 RepID=A0A813FDW7_POLGL|nr:unnamed protein product [Polarella glacialis]
MGFLLSDEGRMCSLQCRHSGSPRPCSARLKILQPDGHEDGHEAGAGAEEDEGEDGAKAVQDNIDTNGYLNIGVLDEFTCTNSQIISFIMKGRSSQPKVNKMCEVEKFQNKDDVIRAKLRATRGAFASSCPRTLNLKLIEEKSPP